MDTKTGTATEIGLLGNANDGLPITLAESLGFVDDQLYTSAATSNFIGAMYLLDLATGDAKYVGVHFPEEPGGAAVMQGLAFEPGPGDADRDGDVDEADVVFFESCYGTLDEPGKSPYCAFLDYDKDGDLDCIDWEAFIHNWTEDTEPPAFDPCDGSICDGDVNADDVVDPLDSGYVLSRFNCPVGQGDPFCDAADSNMDGVVDPLDVGYVLSRFGVCP